MRGFFSKEAIQVRGGERRGFSCASCGLYKHAQTPKMEPYGGFLKRIMVIGEAPNEDEDHQGKPWQGKSGRILQHKYAELGIDLFEDCISLNAVACHPVDKKGDSRTPTNQEISCCRSKIFQAIKKHQPKIIILHGNAPTFSLIGHKWRKDFSSMTKWQGWTIPDREYRAWVCPTFHPSFVMRQEEKNEVEIIWTEDIKRAISKLDEPLPNFFAEEEESIIFAEDMEEIMEKLNQPGLMAFDIETTGLKPYDRERHRIASISFCNNPEYAYVISFPTKPKDLRLLKELLENPKVGKIAANMKFEDNWLNVLHDIRVNPWAFDTMQAAHILDNRPGITGLKFQAYVRYGLLGYEDEIKPYLTSKGSNEPNRILELISSAEGLRKLRVYNGIDSLMEFRLAMKQMEELGMKWDS